MSFVGIVMEAAGILTTVAVASVQGLGGYKGASTGVKLIIGQGDGSMGGSVPHIALWDDHGARIGQYHAKSKDTIDEDGTGELVINHSQTTPPGHQADPMYVMLSNLENNAICISAVYVTNDKISGTFYGDVGYMCGMSWYPSTALVDSNFYTPRCVWLDADHTNGINARALSFHLNDIAAQPDKLAEYNDNTDTICKSTPRFSFWGNLTPDGQIPFFSPPLQYNIDSVNGGQGADKDPKAVIDRDNQYDKSVYVSQQEHHSKRSSEKTAKQQRRSIKTSNINPEHLIITDSNGHSAKEVCEHPNSVGWDIVSTKEGLFCDLADRQLYPLCSPTITVNCFDLNALQLKTLVERDGNFAVHPRGYNTTAYWK
ncbi:hypothetical protein CONLIGDRAFT_706493 [Coniochaeta ligniaria NRRL 30616]|uniref:Uncharacterized protein n=1 Tax=Coniochaeta ligniaria NRRL 30616 TaxID=1408157 RepID=A0A1J7IFT7_9PEZI|nr:hypothetical protein CONLIGDRAFT_706493 [Coniochaeta ligniaria NRRL 30616]